MYYEKRIENYWTKRNDKRNLLKNGIISRRPALGTPRSGQEELSNGLGRPKEVAVIIRFPITRGILLPESSWTTAFGCISADSSVLKMNVKHQEIVIYHFFIQ